MNQIGTLLVAYYAKEGRLTEVRRMEDRLYAQIHSKDRLLQGNAPLRICPVEQHL